MAFWELEISPALAQAPADEWTVAVSLKRNVIADDMQVLVAGDVVFLPLRKIAEAIVIPLDEDKASGTLRSEIFTKQRSFEINPKAQTIRVDGKLVAVPKGAMLLRGKDLYLRGDLLEPLMDIKVEFDRRRGRVALTTEGLLPYQVREAQERARVRRLESMKELEGAKTVNVPYELFTVPVGDISLNSAFNGKDGKHADYSALLTGEIGYLTSRFVVSGTQQKGLTNLRATFGRQDPEGDAFGAKGLTQASVGDVDGQNIPMVGNVTSGRGALVSTMPLDRPDSFDQTTIQGDVTPGWGVELYQNGLLIDFQTAGGNGQYRFENVPLLFGQNVFRLVFYGPQGQQREETRQFNTGADLVPPGQTRFRASAIQARTPLFQALLDRTDFLRGTGAVDRLSTAFEVEHGLSREISIRGFGAYGSKTALQDDGSSLATVGGEVVAKVGEYMARGAVAAQNAGGYAVEAGAFGKMGDWSVSGKTAFYSNFQTPVARDQGLELTNATEVRASTSYNTKAFGALQVSAWANYHRYVNETDRVSATGALRQRIGMTFVGHELEVTSRGGDAFRAFSSWGLYYTPSVSWSKNDFSIQGRAKLAIAGGGFLNQASISTRYRLDTRSSIGLQVGYAPASKAVSLSMTYDHQFDKAILSLVAGWSGTQGAFIGAGLTFSVAADASGRPFLTRYRIAETGAIMPRVFHDKNANSVYDFGTDELLEDVQFTVDNRPRRDFSSDENGSGLIAAANQQKPELIGIDKRSLSDPFLIAAQKGLKVQPRPGRVIYLDIPVVSGGELNGTVWAHSAKDNVPAAGIEVELADANGDVMGRARTLTDGYFLIEAVPPGRYTLRLAADQKIENIRVSAKSRDLTLDQDGSTRNGLDFELRLPKPKTTPDAEVNWLGDPQDDNPSAAADFKTAPTRSEKKQTSNPWGALPEGIIWPTEQSPRGAGTGADQEIRGLKQI